MKNHLHRVALPFVAAVVLFNGCTTAKPAVQEQTAAVGIPERVEILENRVADLTRTINNLPRGAELLSGSVLVVTRNTNAVAFPNVRFAILSGPGGFVTVLTEQGAEVELSNNTPPTLVSLRPGGLQHRCRDTSTCSGFSFVLGR